MGKITECPPTVKPLSALFSKNSTEETQGSLSQGGGIYMAPGRAARKIARKPEKSFSPPRRPSQTTRRTLFHGAPSGLSRRGDKILLDSMPIVLSIGKTAAAALLTVAAAPPGASLAPHRARAGLPADPPKIFPDTPPAALSPGRAR